MGCFCTRCSVECLPLTAKVSACESRSSGADLIDSFFLPQDEDELFASISEQSVSYPKFLSKEAKEMCRALLVKNPKARLGSGPHEELEVKQQPFFRRIDWMKIETRAVQPPWIPAQKSGPSVDNFDPVFTRSDVDLTPADPSIMKNLRGDEFRHFTYFNPSFLS